MGRKIVVEFPNVFSVEAGTGVGRFIPEVERKNHEEGVAYIGKALASLAPLIPLAFYNDNRVPEACTALENLVLRILDCEFPDIPGGILHLGRAEAILHTLGYLRVGPKINPYFGPERAIFERLEVAFFEVCAEGITSVGGAPGMPENFTLVDRFVELAIGDLRQRGQSATAADVARRIGIPASRLSQARTGTKGASLDLLARWIQLWNSRPPIAGIEDGHPRAEIALEIGDRVQVVSRPRS